MFVAQSRFTGSVVVVAPVLFLQTACGPQPSAEAGDTCNDFINDFCDLIVECDPAYTFTECKNEIVAAGIRCECVAKVSETYPTCAEDVDRLECADLTNEETALPATCNSVFLSVEGC